ncbi:MAG: hybrid sensor histidine kinase/response regulator [Oligoflexia bacterium]|nr:hybrid sensor histidine kinase/response regulator [Oligoflexia bacterium]
MINLSNEFEITYNLFMSISEEPDLNKILLQTLRAMVLQLNLKFGAVFAFPKTGESFVSPEVLSCIPLRIDRNPQYQGALKHVTDLLNDPSKLTDDYLVIQIPSAYYYIMKLPHFGILLLLKKGEELSPRMLWHLNSVNRKWSTCINMFLLNEINQKQQIEKTIALTRAIDAEEKAKMQAQLFHSSKLATIGTFAAGMAHEINNPMTIILGNIELIEDNFKNILGKNSLELLQTIKTAGERIAHIVNGLRTYARPDTDRMEKTDVHECITSTIQIIKEIYKKENVILETNLLADDYFIEANIGKIQQVIMNIVSNAKDALVDKKGCIKITTTNEHKKVLIEIADNGSGIPSNIISKLFDPFFTTKDPGKGMGLGLSICYKIIKSFSGSINVESVLGLGTTFKITFPICDNKLLQTSSNEVCASYPVLRARGKILVVDDEEDIRRFLSHILKDIGLDVYEAVDGEMAYAMIKKENFNYVMIDIKMPKMSGDKLIENIKEEKIALGVRFIIITGEIVSEYSSEQRELLIPNADAYLKKPFKKQEIYEILQRLASDAKK